MITQRRLQVALRVFEKLINQLAPIPCKAFIQDAKEGHGIVDIVYSDLSWPSRFLKEKESVPKFSHFLVSVILNFSPSSITILFPSSLTQPFESKVPWFVYILTFIKPVLSSSAPIY